MTTMLDEQTLRLIETLHDALRQMNDNTAYPDLAVERPDRPYSLAKQALLKVMAHVAGDDDFAESVYQGLLDGETVTNSWQVAIDKVERERELANENDE